MTLQDEYKVYCEIDAKKIWKWRYLNNDQRWFIFINNRTVKPKIANLVKPKNSMIWSKSN